MQLMGHGISVFGSRFGIAFDPVKKHANLIRFDKHPGIPFEISVGFELNGKRVYFPLTTEGETFEFCDFDTTPTTMKMIGIDPKSGIRMALKIMIPFRPRDIEFSVTPAIFIDVDCERIQNSYRWIGMEDEDREIKGDFFIKFKNMPGSYEFNYTSDELNNRVKIEYKAPYRDLKKDPLKFKDCINYLNVIRGSIEGCTVYNEFCLLPGCRSDSIKMSLTAYDSPILQVLDELVPFKYSQYFKNIDEVSKWAEQNYKLVEENSKKVDGIIKQQSIGQTYGHILDQTLHTWLTDTWFTVRSNGQDWFTCWEGNCYFHSTVDVEYTETPFYLTVWPELLELLLNEWCYYKKPGNTVHRMDKRGQNTCIMSHDMGEFTQCSHQIYPHDMPIEENANYILMMFSHYLRTGKIDAILKHSELIKKLMDFIVACDSTGNGIVDLGTANTVDDGSPAVQYCSEQIYLGIKAMSAIDAGIHMLGIAGINELDKYRKFVKCAVETIDNKGWDKDHYVVTTMKSLDGLLDSWSRKPVYGEAEGWNEYHIYSVNGLSLLDMCGYKTELDEQHLQTDLRNALIKTELKYGCSHSSYRKEEIAGHPSKIGWISMNMLRDISAAYRGLDFLRLIENYWDWQVVSNSQEYMGFHETFYGNSLCFYPRGIACFGYMDAIIGFKYSPAIKLLSYSPVRCNIRVPLLIFADWKMGSVPTVETSLNDGKITYEVRNLKK